MMHSGVGEEGVPGSRCFVVCGKAITVSLVRGALSLSALVHW